MIKKENPFLNKLSLWIPFAMVFFCVLLSHAIFVKNIFFAKNIPIVYVFIFYFSIFKPELLNVVVVFLLGVLADLLSGLCFGFYTFSFILIFMMGYQYRFFLAKMNFFRLWGVFMVAFLLLTSVQWIFILYVMGKSMHMGFFIFQYISIVLFYPILFVLSHHATQCIRSEV